MLAALYVLGFVGWLSFEPGGARLANAVDDLGTAAPAAVAAGLTALRARAAAGRSNRWGWALLSASSACLGIGDLVYAYYELVAGRRTPFPSPADGAYLAGTALLVPAVVFLGGRTLGSTRLRRLLDGGIIACTLLLISWLTAMHAVYAAGADGTFAFALGLAYPIGDVLIIGIALSTLSHARRPDPALLVVALGIVAMALSDSAFAYFTATATYDGPKLLDAGWPVAYLLLGIASLVPARRDADEERDGGDDLTRWQIVLPYAPLVVATQLVVASLVRQQSLDRFGAAMGLTAVGLVLLRQLMVVVESHSLTAQLRRTLAALRETSTEREIIIEQAPAGICRLDANGRLMTVNQTLRAMLGLPVEDLVGRAFLAFVHVEDRERTVAAYEALGTGGQDRVAIENRLVRGDGSTQWCSQVSSAVRDASARLESVITIIEDITDRKQQAQRAVRIQRQLLPQTTPRLDGYDLAGACLPAQEVAGDLYDWVAGDGYLDLTVADVMGKGVGAALVAAALRTALRAASPEMGPAARVGIAAESMALGLGDEGLFITLFHCRVNLATGRLRYVDAGHGHCVIRRGDGTLVRLSQRSLPIGVHERETFEEGVTWLGSEDTLVVFSDGLVERGERTLDIGGLGAELAATAGAADMVRLLMAGARGWQGDDVTVVVLQRGRLARADSPSDEDRAALTAAVGRGPAGLGQAGAQSRRKQPRQGGRKCEATMDTAAPTQPLP